MSEIQIATYDEIKDLPNHPEAYLIDVRDPPELKETGVIPTSINIPRKCLTLITFVIITRNYCISYLLVVFMIMKFYYVLLFV